MKRYISNKDYLCSLFSLCTSFLVFGTSLLVMTMMVYHNYSVKWTFLCYVISSGWIFVMNITSNVIMLSSKKVVRRENRRTSRQTSVNLDMLNNPDSTRYLTRPAVGVLQQANRTRQSERVSHTPPPSYEDVSKISEEDNYESFSSGEAPPKRSSLSNEKAVYDVLETAQELKKVGEVLKDEYGQRTEKYAQRRNRKNSREAWMIGSIKMEVTKGSKGGCRT